MSTGFTANEYELSRLVAVAVRAGVPESAFGIGGMRGVGPVVQLMGNGYQINGENGVVLGRTYKVARRAIVEIYRQHVKGSAPVTKQNGPAKLRSEIGSYEDAIRALEGRASRAIGNNTHLVVEYAPGTQWANAVSVVLHSTPIVTYHVAKAGSGETFTLNSGGFHTATTKARMNTVMPAGYSIEQRKGEWFVKTPRDRIPFFDGMMLPRHWADIPGDATRKNPRKRTNPASFVYVVDLDERGEYRAHVESRESYNRGDGRAVFSITSDDNGPGGGLWIVEDGFMRNTHDMTGLAAYLVELGVLIPGDRLTYMG